MKTFLAVFFAIVVAWAVISWLNTPLTGSQLTDYYVQSTQIAHINDLLATAEAYK